MQVVLCMLLSGPVALLLGSVAMQMTHMPNVVASAAAVAWYLGALYLRHAWRDHW